MAEFGFSVKTAPSQRLFVQALLRELQALGRRTGCVVRFRFEESTRGYYVTVDGRLPRMEILGLILGLYLPPYARGLLTTQRPQRRSEVAVRVLHRYLEGLGQIQEAVGKIAAELIGGSPNSLLIDVGGATHLQGRATSLFMATLLFLEGLSPADQMVEELHTAAEAFLRYVVPGSSEMSFGGMAGVAVADNVVNDDQKKVLIHLKELRKGAKHQGQSVRPDRADGLVWDMVPVMHALASAARRKASPSGDAERDQT